MNGLDATLLETLKISCRKALANNTRFHDYGHALEVLENTKKILQFENGDEDVLFTSALFHDLSNKSGEQEGEDGANLVRDLLENMPDFPKDKIDDVCRLIKSINGGAVSKDEIIINEADRMAIFSKLSIIRAFMTYGQRGTQPKEAIDDFQQYVNKKYANFKLKPARKLAEKDYLFIKNFLTDLSKTYT